MPVAKEDIEKPRRNLIIVSFILLVIQLTGAHFKEISTPAGTLQFERPETIIYCIWAVWAYSLWHFWVLAKGGGPLRDRAIEFTQHGLYVRRIRSAIESCPGKYCSLTHTVIKRGFFNRTAIFKGSHENGSYVDYEVKLNYMIEFFPEIWGDTKSMFLNPDFVQYEFVILLGVTPAIAKLLPVFASLF